MLILQDDNEQTQLPDEWIFDLQHKKQGALTLSGEGVDQAEDLEQLQSSVEMSAASHMTTQLEENGDNFSGTQPSTEVNQVQRIWINSRMMQARRRQRKLVRSSNWGNKKQQLGQLGPVLPMRRNSRHTDNGKTVAIMLRISRGCMEPGNTGINKKAFKIPYVSKDYFTFCCHR